MKTTSRKCFLLMGLTVAAVAGCYSMSPYGPGGFPGPYSVPPGSVPPGGGYPQGAYLGPNGFTANGVPSAALTPTYGVQGTQWESRVGQGANAAAGGSRGQSAEQGAGNNPVPEPREPVGAGNASPAGRNNGYEESAAPFGLNDGANVKLRGVDDGTITRIQPMSGTSRPGDTTPVQPIPTQTAQGSGDKDHDTDAFFAPVPLKPISSARELVPTQATIVAPGPDPYDHDRENYTWLRGVVDYDEQDKSWHLIYDIAPDVNDPYGGDITLLDHPQLQTLKPGDVVLVEGRMDSEKRDRLDKPSYRIDRCSALVPKE